MISTPLLVCLTVLAISLLILLGWWLYLRSQRPQATCAHDMRTQEARRGSKSIEYLSTCAKCGHQESHHFGGLNGC